MIYIANDVESAGGRLGFHSTLSIGSAVITREPIEFEEYWDRGLVFYGELQPDLMSYDEEAMRVGCSHLECLEEIKQKDPRYDPADKLHFSPKLVLKLMYERCEHPVSVMRRFGTWIEKIREGKDKDIVGVTDTVFFDGGRLDLLFGLYFQNKSPYGWKGLDLNSVYRGYTQDSNAKLKQLSVPDKRKKPHKADQDAVYLAQIGRVLLFEKMNW